MADYTRADIDKALSQLPFGVGDIVFCHANVGMFGRYDGRANPAEIILDTIMRRLSSAGTFFVPTFSYSFPNGEPFDVARTPSKMGMLAELVRERGCRSADPCYSVAGIGHSDSSFVRGVAENSFDSRASFFARFWQAGGKILNLNFDAGSTFVHHAERDLDVPYRFDKTFRGTIRDWRGERKARSTIWVRYLDDALEARFEAFDAIARERGKFYTTKLGRGEMGVISAQDTYNLIKETLPKRPWFLTKAEAMGVEPDPSKFSVLP